MRRVNNTPHIPAVRPEVNKAYGIWLKSFEWTYILTLRRHFPITEAGSDKYARNLLKHSKQIQQVWYALERDSYDSMTHLHIILSSKQLKLDRKTAVKALGLKRNPKTLSYFSEVIDKESVAFYCTKYIRRGIIHYDLLTQSDLD